MSNLETNIFEQFKAKVLSGATPQEAKDDLELSDSEFEDVVIAYWDDQKNGKTYAKIDDSGNGFDPDEEDKTDMGGC